MFFFSLNFSCHHQPVPNACIHHPIYPQLASPNLHANINGSNYCTALSINTGVNNSVDHPLELASNNKAIIHHSNYNKLLTTWYVYWSFFEISI